MLRDAAKVAEAVEMGGFSGFSLITLQRDGKHGTKCEVAVFILVEEGAPRMRAQRAPAVRRRYGRRHAFTIWAGHH